MLPQTTYILKTKENLKKKPWQSIMTLDKMFRQRKWQRRMRFFGGRAQLKFISFH